MLPFYENNREIKIGGSRNLVFPDHLHNSVEMLLVTEGTLQLEVQEELYDVKEGDFAIIFPNQTHAYHGGGGAHRMVIAGLQYCGGFLSSLTAFSPECPILPAESLHPHVSFAMKALAEEDPASSQQVFQALIQLILARVIPQLTLRKTDISASYELPERLMQYVGKHFREPLTLDVLARELHVSKYHLSRVFSGKIGMSFTRYINEFRLDYAASRIRTTGDPLTQIWLEAGFDSQRTFNRVFRQTFGMSPSEYRKT